MLAFSRLTSILFFVLSLGFLACAAPTSSSQGLAVRDVNVDASVMLDACVDVKAKIQAHVDACANVNGLVEATVLINKVVADVQVVVALASKVTVGANVSADIKAKIAAELAIIVKLIVKISAVLVAKLGASVALALCVQLDAVVKVLLLSLDACVSGVLALFIKLVVDIDVNVLLNLNLYLIAQTCGLIKVSIVTGVKAVVGAGVGVAL